MLHAGNALPLSAVSERDTIVHAADKTALPALSFGRVVFFLFLPIVFDHSQIVLEKLFQLIKRDLLYIIVQIDMPCAFHEV